jgi:hypothetical protein
MIFRRTFQTILIFLVSLYCKAQTDTLLSILKTSSDLRISYNSSLIYPGIRIGIGFPVNSLYITKNYDSGKSKSIVKDRFISSGAGWYHHTDFHDNLYFTIEWMMRRTHQKGIFTEFSSGLGYSRTFLGATTYQVNRNGDVNILKKSGYDYAMLIAGGGFGFDFSRRRKRPFSVFYKVDILLMVPYNSSVYFRPVMELGIIYEPVNFFQVKTKTGRVKK